MQRYVLLIIILISSFMLLLSVENYNTARERQYTREVEYYQNKADDYRLNAQKCQKKADEYLRKYEYYARDGYGYNAHNYKSLYEDMCDEYENQMRHASNADENAAEYLKQSRKTTSKIESTMIYLWIGIIAYILYANRERILSFFRRIFRRE